LRSLFERVRAALEPGGLFLFDLVEQQGAHHDWFEGPGYVLGVDTTADAHVVQRRIVLFRELEGGLWRRSDEVHRARLQPRDGVLADLRAAGFGASTFAGYADGSPLRAGVVGYVGRR
jgi:hypothetical protein